jgi:hypothetical protein
VPTQIVQDKVLEEELKHLQMCLNDLNFYSANHLKIVTKQGHKVPLVANAAQRELDGSIAKQKAEKGYVRQIVLKARQEGISTRVGGRNFRAANLLPNRSCVVIAHKEKPASKIFKMYERFEENLDPGMHPGKVSSQRGNYLEFANGSSISVETAGDPEAGRSQTIHLLHASEVAFWPRPDQVYTAVAQTVPDEAGEIIIESTANGVGNFFHRLWKAAENGENDFVPVFLPWFIHEEYRVEITEQEREIIINSEDPIERKALDEGYEYKGEMVKLTPEQLMWRRRTIANKLAGDVRKFRQEYPATPREAFITTGDTFFDPDRLELYELDSRAPLTRGTFVKAKDGFQLQLSERGYVRIWEAPHSGGLYVIGADTSSGEKVAAVHDSSEEESEKWGRDYSCAQVFDVKTRTVVAQLHGRMEPPEFAAQLNWLGYYFGSRGPGGIIFPATLAVEKNHKSGETTIKKLVQEHHYPAMYYARTLNVRTRKVTPVIGWVTTKVTRRPMLDELAEAVRDYDLIDPGPHAIVIFDAATIGEMATFVRGDDGEPRAQEGTHDDRVMALAITLQAAQSQRAPTGDVPETEETPDTPTGGFDYGYDQ